MTTIKGKVLKISILLFFLFVNGNSFAQDSSNVKLMPYYSAWGGHVDYSYFNANSIGLGINFLAEPLHKRIAKKQLAYCFDATLTGLFYHSTFSVGQRLDFGINCEGLSPDLHVFFEHNDKSDVRLGGKLGISLGNFIYIHYRYSFPIGKYENTFISRHGITVTLKLNWVAVSHLYGV